MIVTSGCFFFLRLVLAGVLLSASVSKLAHPRQFQRAIQEYQVLPSGLQAKRAFLLLLAFAIPLAELLAGGGLISGFWLIPAVVGALALFVLFSLALTLNLVRGRRDISCQCGGVMGNHLISWWLVGRNGLLLLSLLALLLTPPDSYTVTAFVQSPSLWNRFLLGALDAESNRVYAAEHHAQVPLLTIARGLDSEVYNVHGVPFAFVLDEEGVVHAKGLVSQAALLTGLLETAFAPVMLR